MTKILIVDDEPACVLFLGDEGYDVQSAETGNEAISIGKSFTPDFLITDWMLKDAKDGLDVAKELLEALPSLKIIFITGMAADSLRDKLCGISVLKIVEKPVDLDQILRTVQSAAS